MRGACVGSVVATLLLWAACATEPDVLGAVDILGERGLCGGLASCAGPPVPGDDQRNCECDPKCRDYADCCQDSPHFSPGAQQATCVAMRQYGLRFIFATCPATWSDDAARQLCERADPRAPDQLASTPVTHQPTGRTFANVFCAACNDHAQLGSLAFWEKRLECPSVRRDLDAGDVMDGVHFDAALGQWAINVSGVDHRCKMDAAKPDRLEDFSRPCAGSVVAGCPSDWHDDAIRSECESYTSTVYEISRRVRYRNPHCAVCNGVPVANITCSIPQGRDNGYKFDMQSFAILFDFSTSRKTGGVGKTQACDDNQLFDPFFRICRGVFCSQGLSYSDGNCISGKDIDNEPPTSKNVSSNCTSGGNTTRECTDSEQLIETCPKFMLGRGEYVISDNGSMYVSKYNKTFLQSEFINSTDGSVYICATTIGEKFIDKFGPLMGYVTIVGLGISILFLILHLVASAFYTELRNLPNKNLASLCVALLCSYILFIKMTYVQNLGTTCRVVGFLTYYSFMASFAWTLAIGFDIWQTMRLATSQFLVSSGKRNCKFLLYSAWSWGVPLAWLAAVVVVDMSPAGSVPDHARPGIGRSSCWFDSRQALLLFFALPFAAVMLLNAFFACSSICMIRSTEAANAASTSRRNVGLYVRLAVIMGLAWTVGLAAGYFDVPALWYVFVAINTLQGLFIFLSFTCSTKMARQLKRTRLAAVDRATASCWPTRPPSTLTTQLDSGDMRANKREKSPMPPELNGT